MNTRDDEVLERLARQEKREGKLSPVLRFYRDLLSVQSRVRQRLGPAAPAVQPSVLRERLEQGMSMLSFEDLGIDRSLLVQALAEVGGLFARYPELFDAPPAETTIDAGVSLETIKGWYETGRLAPAEAAGSALREAIVQAALKPFLVSHAGVLARQVEQEAWRRGYCPVCGGSPDFAFLDQGEGSRWLMCSRCDTQWLYQRLQCPYCGTEDRKALSYFTDDEGLYRLYTCEKCQGYLKAIDLRRAKGKVLLPLERFLTLDIDVQANQSGYQCPARVASGAQA